MSKLNWFVVSVQYVFQLELNAGILCIVLLSKVMPGTFINRL